MGVEEKATTTGDENRSRPDDVIVDESVADKIAERVMAENDRRYDAASTPEPRIGFVFQRVGHPGMRFLCDAALANCRDVLLVGVAWGWFGFGFVVGRRSKERR